VFISILKNKHFQFVLLVLVGSYFIYLSVRNIQLADLWLQIQSGNYWIALPIMCISMVGYYFRSLRWKLILQNMDEQNTNLKSLYASLSMGYAVNFATPRLGEITRCFVLKKSAKTPIEKTIISVFIERVIDVICLATIVGIASWLSIGVLDTFVTQQIFIPLQEAFLHKPWFVLLPVLFTLFIIGYWLYKKLDSHAKFKLWINQLFQCISSVLLMKQKMLFLLYTLCIWLCYFFMTFLWFDVFTETSHLGLREAFIIMAVGSVGRSVPVQGGGMGAYHFLVSNVFGLLGISSLLGNALAFVIHGTQMILTVFLGIIAWVWLLMNTEK
jgi:uncharacterized protein (TIRG00374 family)